MNTSLQECALTGQPANDTYIVDAHAHMGPYFGFRVVDEGSPEAMVRMMDRLGIDVTILSPHIAITCDYREGNRQAAEAAARFPGRIIPFITINPNYPLAEIEAEIAHWDETTGIKCFKFHTDLHAANSFHDGYTPVYEYADERELPILSHTWSGPGGPIEVVRTLAERYPGIRFLEAHTGNGWSTIDRACEMAEACDRAYLDITGSQLLYGGLERMVERVGAERVLFGTDAPFIDPRPGLGRLLCADISDEDKRKILGLNAKELYRL